MSAPPLYLVATERERNIIPVEWRIGPSRPKGIVHIIMPDEQPNSHDAAIAELTAIRYLVDSRQVGSSLRPHKVFVSQREIKNLMHQEAGATPLVPYGRFLYLYVHQDKLGVEKSKWAEGVEIDPARISITHAIPSNWPGGFCPVLGAEIGITRHAVERFIERSQIKNDYWHAFQMLQKRLQSSLMRIVPREEIAKTNPGMRMDARTMLLHHQGTDTDFLIVKEEEGWVLVTTHAHHQEYVPTIVGTRVEYRRAT